MSDERMNEWNEQMKPEEARSNSVKGSTTAQCACVSNVLSFYGVWIMGVEMFLLTRPKRLNVTDYHINYQRKKPRILWTPCPFLPFTTARHLCPASRSWLKFFRDAKHRDQGRYCCTTTILTAITKWLFLPPPWCTASSSSFSSHLL